MSIWNPPNHVSFLVPGLVLGALAMLLSAQIVPVVVRTVVPIAVGVVVPK